jgi:hypothetical protein
VDRRLTPVRRVALAVAAIGLAGGLSACNDNTVIGRPPLATVNGHHIERSEVERLITAQRAYFRGLKDDKKISASQANQTIRRTFGATRDSYSMSAANQSLNQLVTYWATIASIEARGGHVTAADKSKAKSDIESQLGNGDPTAGQTAEKAVPKALLDAEIQSRAALSALGRVLTKENAGKVSEKQLRAAYPAFRKSHPTCLSVILTQTEQDATAAKAKIDGGASFAEVAQADSLDQPTAASGGFAGCNPPEAYSQQLGIDLTKAPVGEPQGPLSLGTGSTGASNGFLVYEVTSNDGPSYAQAKSTIKSQLQDQLTGSDAVQKEQARILARAKVAVDSRLGSWNPKTGQVEPPS